MSILPNDGHVQVITCDDIRIEVNKKLTLVGFYIGNRINLANVGAGIMIPLSFMIVIDGGEGNFAMHAELITPTGTKLIEDNQELTKIRNTPAIHIIKVFNLPITATGEYKMNIQLDGKSFKRVITLGHDPSLSNPPT